MTTSITTRAGKGSPLTHDEVDANFTNLQTTADAALPLAGGTLTGPVGVGGPSPSPTAPLTIAAAAAPAPVAPGAGAAPVPGVGAAPGVGGALVTGLVVAAGAAAPVAARSGGMAGGGLVGVGPWAHSARLGGVVGNKTGASLRLRLASARTASGNAPSMPTTTKPPPRPTSAGQLLRGVARCPALAAG